MAAFRTTKIISVQRISNFRIFTQYYRSFSSYDETSNVQGKNEDKKLDAEGAILDGAQSVTSSLLGSTTGKGEHQDLQRAAKVGGFARAFEKFSRPTEEKPPPVKGEDASFLSLLRNSKFIDIGDPENKIVQGTIFHIVGNDLYIDFGGKFHCVCPRPIRNGRSYVRGAKVRLRLKDMELSSRFLGSDRDMTLMEADAILLGIISSPAQRTVA